MNSFHSRVLATAVTSVVALGVWTAIQSGGGGSGPPPPTPILATDAARFLTQASYGPTDASIAALQSQGLSAWIDQQETIPQPGSTLQYMQDRRTALLATNPKFISSLNELEQSYWNEAVTGPDQLRERMKLALSEIFVTSFQFSAVDPRGMGSYWDMLGDNAFGNFRTLMEKVTYHPQMARYLTSLQNQKEDPVSGKTPDENYAREIMQLMTIGLWQLNQDGTQKLDSSGNPIPTYTHDDIAGLARVFTGMSFYNANPTNSTFFGGSKDPNSEYVPLIMYNNYHSTSQKSFLGTTIPASTTANGVGDIKIALDTIFNHPNVGPFIATQLIKRFVTSNPSPAYVSRVAGVFNNNGSGVRGDLGAVIKAVLTDTEARNPAASPVATYGKLREPLVRVANWARAFGASSQSGLWMMNYFPGGTSDQATSLYQRVLDGPSVFNFWRPGFTPSATSKLGAAGLTAPEFQAVDEVSVASYANAMQSIIGSGVGYTSPPSPDVITAYPNEVALATDPAALAARLDLLLTYGTMSAGLKQSLITAVNAIAMPAATATAAQIQTAKLNRVKLAIYMVMTSPEYVAQR